MNTIKKGTKERERQGGISSFSSYLPASNLDISNINILFLLVDSLLKHGEPLLRFYLYAFIICPLICFCPLLCALDSIISQLLRR